MLHLISLLRVLLDWAHPEEVDRVSCTMTVAAWLLRVRLLKVGMSNREAMTAYKALGNRADTRLDWGVEGATNSGSTSSLLYLPDGVHADGPSDRCTSLNPVKRERLTIVRHREDSSPA